MTDTRKERPMAVRQAESNPRCGAHLRDHWHRSSAGDGRYRLLQEKVSDAIDVAD